MLQKISALYPQYFERYKALKFVYFVTMKVFFVGSAEAIVYLMYVKFKATYGQSSLFSSSSHRCKSHYKAKHIAP